MIDVRRDGETSTYEEMRRQAPMMYPCHMLFVDGKNERRSEHNGAGKSDEVSDNFFTITDVKQVKSEKVQHNWYGLCFQFTETFVHLKVSEFHDRLHEIFVSLLNAITKVIISMKKLLNADLLRSVQLLILPKQTKWRKAT